MADFDYKCPECGEQLQNKDSAEPGVSYWRCAKCGYAEPEPPRQPEPDLKGYKISFGALFIGSESGEQASQHRLGSIFDPANRSVRPTVKPVPTRQQRLTILEKDIEAKAEMLEELRLEYDFHMAICWHPFQKRLVDKNYKPTVEGVEKELADLRAKYHATLEEMDESPEQAALRDGEAMRQLVRLYEQGE
jgi:DNA-directed RNA polymerase subunit RPC12/RpoP